MISNPRPVLLRPLLVVRLDHAGCSDDPESEGCSPRVLRSGLFTFLHGLGGI